MDQDRRSPLAVGMEWASRVTTMGLGFALPPVAGHFADRRFGTAPALVIVGTILGFAVGIVQLVRLARASSRGL